MTRNQRSWSGWVLGVTLLLTCLLSWTGLCALAADAPGAKPIGAKVICAVGGVEVQAQGDQPKALEPGDYVHFGEDVIISKGGSATIALSDKTLREFNGPATLAVRQEAGPTGGTVIGNLTQAVADMLFSGKVHSAEAVMATRSAGAGAGVMESVPLLLHPSPGENLMEAPRQFRWKGIDGVPLYRVSVYSGTQMMWQGTTSDTKAGCPPKTCEFKPGEVYYWVVEAVVGNTSLRSRAADFTVLDADQRLKLAGALGEADKTVTDSAGAAALKARLCLDAGAYAKALEVIDQAIAVSPNRAVYLLRAEANGAMGLAEEALGDYRAAIALPAAK